MEALGVEVNHHFGTESGPFRGDPCMRAIRPLLMGRLGRIIKIRDCYLREFPFVRRMCVRLMRASFCSGALRRVLAALAAQEGARLEGVARFGSKRVLTQYT
jgi:hypothetical protein